MVEQEKVQSYTELLSLNNEYINFLLGSESANSIWKYQNCVGRGGEAPSLGFWREDLRTDPAPWSR